MATLRGLEGFLVLGGYLVGTTIAVNGTVLAGAATVSIDGSPLTGVILPGDTFTVTGVLGTYTVTNVSALLAAGNAITGITFSPVAPVGGFPDNAVFILTANAVANMRQWMATSNLAILDKTVMGEYWNTCVGGLGSWTGSFRALLDYGDPRQAVLVNAIMAGTPVGQLSGLFFGVQGGVARGLYGAPLVSSLSIESQLTDLVMVSGNFAGTDKLLTIWQ